MMPNGSPVLQDALEEQPSQADRCGDHDGHDREQAGTEPVTQRPKQGSTSMRARPGVRLGGATLLEETRKPITRLGLNQCPSEHPLEAQRWGAITQSDVEGQLMRFRVLGLAHYR
jgi:hypothetical protein